MRRLFLATFAVVALAAGSAAADGLKDRPVRAVGCAQFGGFYLGANVGWAYHDATWVDRNAWVDNFSNDWALGSVGSTRDGIVGGVQGGYNWQRGCTVIGFEVDASWAGLDSSKVYTPVAGAGTTLTLDHDVRWYGTLRTRSGLIVDNLLLYVTGGLAYANIKNDFTVNDPGGTPTAESFSAKNARWGWVGGVGTEWAWSDRVTIKSEVLYIRFSEVETTGFSPNGNSSVVFDHQDSMWVSRFGINFKFGTH